MSKLKLYKKLLIALTILILIGILLVTIDVISETTPRKFNIDFEKKSDIISGYGTLIGGILSFLSILFVILSLLEQRQQILRNEHLNEEESNADLLDKLILLSSFLKSLIDTIQKQGEIMKEYCSLEKTQPSKMNKMYFLANRNFARVVEMDTLSIYKGIRFYFKKEAGWEKLFLNLYTLVDFYKEGLEDLKTKYSSQIDFKVKEQRKIGDNMLTLMNMCASLVDDYKISHPSNYMTFPWTKLINEFTGEYYGYLKLCEDNNEASDFRVISDDLLLPFLKIAMDFRDRIGYDTMGSRNIVGFIADIRKKINEIEVHCKFYASDIEEQYNTYFSNNNENIKQLRELKAQIDLILKQQ